MTKPAILIFVLLSATTFIVPPAGAQSANPPKQQSSADSPDKSGANAGPITVKAQAQQTTPANTTAPTKDNANAVTANSSKYLQVPTGTVLPLVLHNAVSTRSAKPGD